MKGDLFFIQNGASVDAYDRYGISLEPSAMAALMTPPPIKQFVDNKSRLRAGKEVITDNPQYDEREVSLPLHINARTTNEFLDRYNKFCNEVLAKGAFTILTRYNPNVYYRLVYLSCSQYTEFRMEYAAFALKCTEPDPTDRASTSK